MRRRKIIFLCLFCFIILNLSLSSCLRTEHFGQIMEFHLINSDTEYAISIQAYCAKKESNNEYKGVIPKEYNGKPVTSIDDFSNSLMSSFKIPNFITNIDESAFRNSNIITITFEEGSQLISIGDSAFGNTVIEEILLPDSLVNLGDKVFEYCTSLKSIGLSNNLTCLGDYLFQNCNSLTSINIPSSILQIGEYAFKNCSSLTNINFEEESLLETIESFAFQNCKNITKITLPDNLKIIKEFAFMDCEKLAEVDNQIGSNLEKIGGCAFFGCKNLEKFSFNENLKIIEGNAFGFSYKLNPFIPQNVNYIGSNAFSSNAIVFCEAEEKPAEWNFDWINPSFVYFTTLNPNSSIYWGVEKEDIIYKDDYVYLKNNDNVIIANYIGTEEITEIPSQLEGLSVTEIGKSAFDHILSSSVVINDCITRINEISFWRSADLEAVTIPQNVDYIGDYAFNYCGNLKNVTIKSIIPPYLGENVFTYTSEDLKIYVPAESLDAYKSADGWSEYADIIYSIED